MSEQEQMELEASHYFILNDFISLFELDPKKVTQDLLNKYPDSSQHLSYLLTYFSVTAKLLS